MKEAAPSRTDPEDDLDAYAAQAAHQLGEAVALLRGYLVVLEQHGRRNPEIADALGGLRAGTGRAQRFVDDLLDLAASGRTTPARERVELDDALAHARGRLETELRDAVTEVSVGALPVARGDTELVVRLFVHLIRVALAAGARAIDVTGAPPEHGLVRIEVRDDGAPIAGDPFAPFARARGRGPLVGAGVGLTVCRRIVEAHGGSIALGPDPDGATRVTFTLRADEAP